MASVTQKRVLLGLQAGLKLREVLQEPHMPSLRMLDEWLTNPEYHAAYLAALATGQHYRDKQMAHRPVAPALKLATEMDKPELNIVLPPTVDITYMSPAPVCPVPAAADIAKFEPLIDEAFYAATLPLAIDDDTLKQLLMQRLRDGEFSSKMIDNTPGFYADKLQAWRKEPDFVAEWNAAKAVGRNQRRVNGLLREPLPPVAPVSPFLVVEPVVSSHIVIPPPPPLPIYEAPCEPAPDPALEYLPEGGPRFVVLKAEELYNYLMSEDEARAIAAEDTARTGQPHYVSRLIAVAAPLLSAVLHPIA